MSTSEQDRRQHLSMFASRKMKYWNHIRFCSEFNESSQGHGREEAARDFLHWLASNSPAGAFAYLEARKAHWKEMADEMGKMIALQQRDVMRRCGTWIERSPDVRVTWQQEQALYDSGKRTVYTPEEEKERDAMDALYCQYNSSLIECWHLQRELTEAEGHPPRKFGEIY